MTLTVRIFDLMVSVNAIMTIKRNKITMKSIKTETESSSLWQEILSISTEINDLGLTLINLDVNKDNLQKVTSVLERSKQAIAKIETKNRTR